MQQNVYTCLQAETCHQVPKRAFEPEHGAASCFETGFPTPQVFVDSLLCSSRVDNIRLAGQLMHCSKVQQKSFRADFGAKKHTHASSCCTVVETFPLRFQVSQDVPVSLSFRGKGHALKVAYDKSVELVLAAAREYFNSSTTLKDACMGLAR